MKLNLLLLSLLSDFVNCFDSTSIVCSLIPYTLDFSQNLSYLWGKATMQDADRYAFLIISPILIIAELLILKFYYDNPKIIGRTGIIVTIIVIFEIFLNLHFLISAIYYTVTYSLVMPSSFPLFCQINSIIAAFFEIIHIIFLILVPIYIVYILRSSLKNKSKIWKFIYTAIFIISLVVTYIMWSQGILGLNIFGLCGLTFIRFPNSTIAIPITIFSITVIFFMIGIFSIRYFKRHMPNSIGLRKKKRYEQQVILLYVIGYVIFGVLDSVILLVLYLNCNQTNPTPDLVPLITIYNFVRLIECLYIFFIIFKNQNPRRAFKKFLKKFFSKKNLEMMKKAESMSSNPNDNDIHNFEEVLLSIQQQNNSIDFLKISQVVTIVSGIYIAYKQYYNIKEEYFNIFNFKLQTSQALMDRATLIRRNANTNFSKSTKNIYYHQKMTIKINLQIVQDFIQDPTVLPKFGILECSMIIHSPKIFQHLLQNDKLQLIFQSFQLHQNARKMFDLAEGQGGKSGQFFFYSSDNKFVLKTITPEEFQFIDTNLFYFHEHFIRNPDSILAKIYGLFTFKGDQMQRTYHLILMKNMLACQNSQIIRTYDMKGSRYDREVNVKNRQINQLQKMTLKDIDFMKQEGIIHISNDNKVKLSEIITKDSLFLKNLNLIDYSLLVIKVKWLVPPRNPYFWAKYQRIQSCINRDEYYHIGIIDYLQQWDLQKKGEQWWKNLLGKKDISAQEPKYYHKRFVTFVGQITSDFCLRKQIEILNCDQDLQGKSQFNPKKFENDLLKLQRLQREAEYLKQKINYITNDKEVSKEIRQIEMSLSNNIGSSLSRQKQKTDYQNSIKISTLREDQSCRSKAGSSSIQKYMSKQKDKDSKSEPHKQ